MFILNGAVSDFKISIDVQVQIVFLFISLKKKKTAVVGQRISSDPKKEKTFPGLKVSLLVLHSTTDCEPCAELQMSRVSFLF